MINFLFKQTLKWFFNLICVFILLLVAFFFRYREKNQVVFGTTPIISYAYWSRALKEKGYPTCTLMKTYYKNNSKGDFDYIFPDVTPKFFKKFSKICQTFGFIFILKNARLFVTSYDHIVLDNSFSWFEIIIMKIARVSVIILPYGSDAYMYSTIKDPSLQHAALISYPGKALCEREMLRNIRKKNEYADVVICGFQNEGIGRWDLLLHQFNHIDSNSWLMKESFSQADGINNHVRIIHTPNHTGFKGSEFIKKAIIELKNEGLKIDYLELTGVSNSQIKMSLLQSDILVEQLIFTGYALSGIEGMASGLTVLSNLDSSLLTAVFRRYSFLDECPIVSVTPENIKDTLKVLITQPKLREELGRAGREYVEKYHSYKAAQYMFGAIYDKVIYNKDVDLMSLFHPISSPYNNAIPKIKHPLVKNRLMKTTEVY